LSNTNQRIDTDVKRILLQLDGDSQPSAFDSVVAIDSDVDELLRFDNVEPVQVTSITHGAMFTRGGDELKNTAIFVGGSDVSAAEKLFERVQKTFFGPVRVSVMLDASGCNTTAAAAVVAAGRHQEPRGATAVVLGGTGPVGRRVAEMLVNEGAHVRLTSRSIERAQSACDAIAKKASGGSLSPMAAGDTSDETLAPVLEDASILIACGAAGVELIGESTVQGLSTLKVAIDLNAVPPAGIGGVAVTDKARPIEHGVVYGAVGVGGLKMKAHRAAIKSLFESNDKVLDAAEIYAIAKSIG
tara:strand:+ start:30076 stop:30975 length:900 start_codon:yes stop_codon:yes gene_type:complete